MGGDRLYKYNNQQAIALQERRAKQEAEAIAKQERLIALQERNKNEKLAAYLRSLGINPDDIQ